MYWIPPNPNHFTWNSRKSQTMMKWKDRVARSR
jgi:hypothetical protein